MTHTSICGNTRFQREVRQNYENVSTLKFLRQPLHSSHGPSRNFHDENLSASVA